MLLPTTKIHLFVQEANAGRNPRVITKLPSGWVVIGEKQVMPGYCLLLPDPVVPHLNALTPSQRSIFLSDMASIGDAVLKVTGAVRINYEMLGNLEPALHAHIIPRFDNLSDPLRTKPIWFYDWDAAENFDLEKHGQLMSVLKQSLSPIAIEHHQI